MNLDSIDRKQRRKPAVVSNMIYGKVPPQAKEMEDAVLGAIMLERDAFDTASEILTPQCFYSESNQRVFKAMKSLADKRMPIDLLTVVQELRLNEDLDIVGGPYGVSKLTNAVVSGVNIVAHANIVLEMFLKREIIKVAGELISQAYEDSTNPYELVEHAGTTIMDLGTNHVHGDMVNMSTAIDSTMTKVAEWMKSDGTLTGVPTGFDELDKVTRGWQPGDLIYIGARPSVGKTALALNLIRNAALGVKPTTVAVWSLEMDVIFLVLRMLAAESEVWLQRLQTGQLEDYHLKQLQTKGIDKLKKANIFFDDHSTVNLRTIRAKAKKLKKKNNLGLIVIDYLQLMEGEDKEGNREREISKISRGLKRLAKDLQVPIIALSQLSREAVKGVNWETAPGTSAFRESGSIEQDADLLILLWGPTEEEEKQNAELLGKRKLKVAKQRNGNLKTIEFDFRNEIQLFEAMDGKQVSGFKPINHNDKDNPF